MTTTQFLLSSALKILGFKKKQKRLRHANSETFLLKKIEVEIGAKVWTKVKEVETLAESYSIIAEGTERRLEILKDLNQSVEAADSVRRQRLDVMMQESSLSLNKFKDKKAGYVHRINRLNRECQKMTKTIKDTEGSLLTSQLIYESLSSNQVHVNQLAAAQRLVDQNQKKLNELKKSIQDFTQKIASIEKNLEELDSQIEDSSPSGVIESKGLEENLLVIKAKIGALRSELNQWDQKLHDGYQRIGEYMSSNFKNLPLCGDSHGVTSDLIFAVKVLRKSIHHNNQLADNF